MLLKKIIYFILSVQEKILLRRLSNTVGVKNSSMIKKHYFNGCTIDLNNLAEAEKQKLEEEITLILKENEYSPEKLLEYVKKQGTNVYSIKNSNKFLNPIGENEGFIYPARGLRAIYLSLCTDKNIKLKTDEMFIVSTGEINQYYFIYHFYNWFAFKKKIFGISRETQELLNKYLYTNADTKELQLAEIYKLKDAITQDKASLAFVINLCKNYEGAKNALDKIKNDGGAKL